MKMNRLNGILLMILAVLFNSCTEPVTPPEQGLKYVEFGVGGTRAGNNFFWDAGDQVCIYSLVDGEITYKDTVTISNPNGNGCKVRGLVDVNSTRYFFTYPMNGILDEVGDELNDEHFRMVYDGEYKHVSMMTGYVNPGDKNIWFQQRFSLLKIQDESGTVTISSSLPAVHTFTGNTGEYYIPISYKSERVEIILDSRGMRKTKNLNVEPGIIYSAR